MSSTKGIVALVFDDPARKNAQTSDLPDVFTPPEGGMLDMGHEWEDERTLAGLVEAVRACGHRVIRVPFDPDLVRRLDDLAPAKAIILNIAEGVRGRNRESLVPAICEILGLPYTCADATGLALTLDKRLAKTLAARAGAPTAEWALVSDPDNPPARLPAFPLFVKPNAQGSSMGIRPDSVAHDLPELRRKVAELCSGGLGPALVETYLAGPELHVAIMGDARGLTVFPPALIETDGRVYDASMKTKERMEERVICPAPLAEAARSELVGFACTLYNELGLHGPCRFDFKCDAAGLPHFLEANPLPGISRYYSVYTMQAQAAGLSYEEMIGAILEGALHRRAP